jgi:hypothetical protein
LGSLSLASLARHLLGEVVDKTPQRSDWGVRPLHSDQLAYAAADPEWCFRIQDRLDELLVHIDPAAEDPDALQARYIELLLPLAELGCERKAIRGAVQSFMEATDRVRFGGFSLHQRIAQKTTLADPIALALREDPGRRYDLTFSVSQKLRGVMNADACMHLQPHCRIVVGRSFRGPRLERRLRPAASTYEVCADDATAGRVRDRPAETVPAGLLPGRARRAEPEHIAHRRADVAPPARPARRGRGSALARLARGSGRRGGGR